jgi:cytochrome c556
MKIRALLFTLICALVTSTGVLAADAETELGGKMEKMGGAFRALRRQITDSSKNADSLAKVATIRQNAEASMKLDPAMKKDIPAAKQAKFVADYQAEMKKFIALCDKLTAALKANNNAEAEKLCAQMGDAQKAGHKSYKKEDKKKKG